MVHEAGDSGPNGCPCQVTASVVIACTMRCVTDAYRVTSAATGITAVIRFRVSKRRQIRAVLIQYGSTEEGLSDRLGWE